MLKLFLKIIIGLFVAVILLVALIASCAKDAPKTTSQKAQEVKLNQTATDALKKHMDEFKGASWYSEDMVFEVHSNGARNGVIVKTKYYPKEETKKLAQQLATVLSQYDKVKFDYIQVMDKDGNILYNK